jgi:hypothetical protein
MTLERANSDHHHRPSPIVLVKLAAAMQHSVSGHSNDGLCCEAASHKAHSLTPVTHDGLWVVDLASDTAVAVAG